MAGTIARRSEAQFQSETGLHQNWMRDYDPTTGRYIQADPLGLVDGASVYGYARQSPMMYVDPTGQCPWCMGAAVAALTNIAIQLFMNGFDFKCINWLEVGVSSVAGAGIGGVIQKFGKISTSFAGPKRPTYRLLKTKKIRIESHPIKKSHPNQLSYPHWHYDGIGKAFSKRHLPLVEPIVALGSILLGECGCNEQD